MTLVAGVDSSTQSCKVVVCDADTGDVLRSGAAPHPSGTEVDPHSWEKALHSALDAAGGLDDVAALSVAGQQHGLICLDAEGDVVRPALLWNDIRSAAASQDLIGELGGGARWAEAVGSVPVASFTVTKLRWLARNEPASAERTAAVCLPHDWLTWRLLGTGRLDDLVTDRGDASGTGYWSPATGRYRPDLLELALGAEVAVPRVLAPAEPAGAVGRLVLGPGTGDNAGAVLGLAVEPGDVVVSVGTSGVVCARHPAPSADPTGTIAGFASATGDFLPLVCTLNAARVLDGVAGLLGVSLRQLSDLALRAPLGAGGLVLIPYFEGERTPNRPDAAASLHGLRLANISPEGAARAAVEGMLCGLADGFDALVASGVGPKRVVLIGGGSRSEAVRTIAPAIFGRPVYSPPAAEYVALGAARQAAWTLAGGEQPPPWSLPRGVLYEAAPAPAVRSEYASVRDRVYPS